MSETTSTELAIPGIGQIVNLEDPREVAYAIDGIREIERQLRSCKAELTRALVLASQQEGSKTLHYEGVTAVVKGGKETRYDAEAIRQGLLDAGMSKERVEEIVRTEYKLVAAEAKRAAGANPVYKEVIDEHTTEEEIPHSVSISLKAPA